MKLTKKEKEMFCLTEKERAFFKKNNGYGERKELLNYVGGCERNMYNILSGQNSDVLTIKKFRKFIELKKKHLNK